MTCTQARYAGKHNNVVEVEGTAGGRLRARVVLVEATKQDQEIRKESRLPTI